MKIKFTSIPDKIKYPAKLKGILCPMHSEIIEYVCLHPVRKFRDKKKILKAMNILSYLVIQGDTIPSDYSPSNLSVLRVSPNFMFSALPPLISISDLAIAYVSGLNS